MTPADAQVESSVPPGVRARRLWRRYKWFVLIVIAPTLLLAAYLYAMASDQYVSEAHFLVRTQGGGDPAPSAGGITAALGFGGGGAAASSEAQSVSDYLTSHDVVDTLQKRLNLVALFRRPEADIVSRLPVADPTPEFLLRYYQQQVDVYYDLDNGITTLKARAFRPQDAYQLSRTLLALGEQRVNEMNIRGFSDAVSLSRRQLDEAEKALSEVQTQLTRFRQSERDVDPAGTAQAQIGLVSRLSQELSAARAQLATTQSLSGEDSPQVVALRQQIRSLESQLATQNNRLAGGASAIAVSAYASRSRPSARFAPASHAVSVVRALQLELCRPPPPPGATAPYNVMPPCAATRRDAYADASTSTTGGLLAVSSMVAVAVAMRWSFVAVRVTM